MRSMCEIMNLFVDGEITTREEVKALLAAEPEGLAAQIADTATRLCPPAQAERILELLKREGND